MQIGSFLYAVFELPVNTFLANHNSAIIDPPELETALHFLAIFTNLEEEFNRIDLANTGLFDLDHPDTAQQIDLPGAVRAIKNKSQLAKNVLRWLEENGHVPESKGLTETTTVR